MLLYGRNVIREILKSNKRQIYEIYLIKDIKDFDDIIKAANEKKIKLVYKDRKALAELTKTEKNQGIAAKVEGIRNFSVDDFLRKHEGKERVTVAALDEVTDPHNLGAVIRSCEVFGIDGVLITPKCSPITDVVYKTSSGAIEYIDIISEKNLNYALEKLKNNDFWIYGLDLSGDKYLNETEFDKKTVLVFGSEGEGMKQLVKKNCDFLVKIKQKGRLDSLNISNAAAVAFYEVSKGRNQ